jgi:hypothetical protein
VIAAPPSTVSDTSPVGVPPAELTVTVTTPFAGYVTVGALIAVVVAAAFTVWPATRVPVLPEKFPVSGEYTAVTAWFPWVRLAVAPLVAVPLLSVTGAPKLIPSIANCTVPVGVPAPDTIAVNVTLCPKVDGFTDDVTVVVVVPLLIVTVFVYSVSPRSLSRIFPPTVRVPLAVVGQLAVLVLPNAP